MKYLKNEQNAKDGTQQIFIKCIDELAKYEVTYFKSWVYMITKNYCLMQLRNAGQKIQVDIDQVSYYLKDDAEGDQTIEKLKEKNHTIERMLESLEYLNNEQRQCVTLFYLEKKSYQQIAETVGLTYMQVKSAIQNGKRNLKLIIEKK
jgi:RNA polymerase sigma-70 factor (ECF subfamily)